MLLDWLCLNIYLTSEMVKTITVKNEVYRKLLAVKREGESFSDFFERLVMGIEPIETLKRLKGMHRTRRQG